MQIIDRFYKTGWLKKKIFPKNQLFVFSVNNADEFRAFKSREKDLIEQTGKLEAALRNDTRDKFTVTGYCWVCRKKVDFSVDYNFSYLSEGVLVPNLRERLICPKCNLNARKRAALHLFYTKLNPSANSSIYITEQTTLLFRVFQKKFPSLIGSEFLGNTGAVFNETDPLIRNEDLTNLSFNDEIFDYILSFDCFEHIFEYKKAFNECARCLKKNGVLYFSIPFSLYQETNILRAYVDNNDTLVHLLPEEWHGPPQTGFFCFHNFGWQLIEDIKAAGFGKVEVIFYWSWKFGYLGGFKPLFIATK